MRRTSKAEAYHSRQAPEQQQTEPEGGHLLSLHVSGGTEMMNDIISSVITDARSEVGVQIGVAPLLWKPVLPF